MRKIMPWISVNGKAFKQQDAVVSALDYGLLYGYGIFTTLKVREGVPLFLESHLLRLQSGLERLAFRSPLSHSAFEEAVDTIIRTNELIEGAIRITLTPGTEYQTLTCESPYPTAIIYATQMRAPRDFVDVITIPDQRDAFRDMKMTNRLVNLLAEREAFSRGAQEAVFTEGGNLIEATYSNIFSVGELGEFITPSIDGRGLNGIARQHLLDYSGGRVAEISAATAGPLFLVNCLGTAAVRCLDGNELVQNYEAFQKMQSSTNEMELRYIKNRKLSY